MGRLPRALIGLAVLAACGHHHHGFLDAGDDTLPAPECLGLSCDQYNCAPKGLPPTSVSGIVYAPNGTLPLYGVNVYVPASDPGPLTMGATCARCSDGLPGGALTATTTDEMGRFTLVNVPATGDVPLVIQVGKWRRQLKLPQVAACQDFPLDAVETTLPKSRDDLTTHSTSVDMPMIAISTGSADAIECLMLKLGIASKEITNQAGGGHVQLFADPGAVDVMNTPVGEGAKDFVANWPGGSSAAFSDSASTLWNTQANLAAYDITILSCEGGQYPATKPQPSLDAMKAYADNGGRVFMSHWHNIWIGGEDGNAAHGIADWEAVATFDYAATQNLATTTAFIDEMQPKGPSFAQWMVNVGGSVTKDQVAESEPRFTLQMINNPPNAERWVYIDPAVSIDPNNNQGYVSIQDMQFTTPVDIDPTQRCGKVVFSDMHVSSGSTSNRTKPYPGGCACNLVGGQPDPLCTSPQDLSPQEKALAFMFFDIASCVGPIQ
jgi:hypothetical protein